MKALIRHIGVRIIIIPARLMFLYVFEGFNQFLRMINELVAYDPNLLSYNLDYDLYYNFVVI